MQRRGFLLSALSAIAAASATPTGIGKNAEAGAASNTIGNSAQQQLLLLQPFPLAGYQYQQGSQRWKQLLPEAPLSPTREPDRRHYPRSVCIDWNGHKLGYLPRCDNAAVSQLRDRRQQLSDRISTPKNCRDSWDRIAVKIRLGSVHKS